MNKLTLSLILVLLSLTTYSQTTTNTSTDSNGDTVFKDQYGNILYKITKDSFGNLVKKDQYGNTLETWRANANGGYSQSPYGTAPVTNSPSNQGLGIQHHSNDVILPTIPDSNSNKTSLNDFDRIEYKTDANGNKVKYIHSIRANGITTAYVFDNDIEILFSRATDLSGGSLLYEEFDRSGNVTKSKVIN